MIDILNSVLHSDICCGERLHIVASDEAKENEEDVKQVAEPLDRNDTKKPVEWDSDITALERVYGKLHEGMVIETTLKNLLEICPRERRRTDAYATLRNRLRAYGTELRVVSNWENKNYENRES